MYVPKTDLNSKCKIKSNFFLKIWASDFFRNKEEHGRNTKTVIAAAQFNLKPKILDGAKEENRLDIKKNFYSSKTSHS